MTQEKPRFEVGDEVYYIWEDEDGNLTLKISKALFARWHHEEDFYKTFEEAKQYLLDQVNKLVEG